MIEIAYVQDPEDNSGVRCAEQEGEHKCHRRAGHSLDTTVLLKIDDENDTMVPITFNHRTLAAGRYFTW